MLPTIITIDETKFGQKYYRSSLKAMPHGSETSPEKNRNEIRCVCHTEGLKSWQIMKKMTHKNLKIVKKLVLVSDI